MNDARGALPSTLLRVDLNRGTIVEDEIPAALAVQALGGNGLGVQMLWDEVPPSLDPLDSDSLLVLAAGALTGTSWPCAARLEAIGKSPLTGIYGDSNCGGFFGPELRFSGVDAIAVSGRASEPVMLWIEDGRSWLEPAAHLWGLDTVETEASIRAQKGDPHVKVACVGPAAEQGVLFGSIQCSPGRSLARSGLGTLMASKRLKAIAVRGKRRIDVADPDGFARLSAAMHKRIRGNAAFPAVSKYGTPGIVELMDTIGRFPTHNFRTGSFEASEAISGAALRERFWVKDTGCFACPVRCDKVYRVTGGDFDGVTTSSFEYETLTALGSGVGVGDLGAVLAANDRCDRLGLDTISTGRVISFAVELFELGILHSNDTGGMQLRWGDSHMVLALIEQIAGRRGLGELLALGVRRAAAELGPGAADFAMEVKGLEIPGQDGRAQQSMGLAHITSSRGADHLKAFPTLDEAGDAEGVRRRYGDAYLPEMADPQATLHKPLLVKDGEDFGAVVDSVGVCKSGGTFVMAELYWAEIAAGLTLACGEEYDEATLRRLGERIVNLMRAYNALHGVDRRDDRLPRRFHEEPASSGGAHGHVAHAEEMLNEYYDLRGWDRSRGWPTSETLRRLDLADVAERLEGLGHG